MEPFAYLRHVGGMEDKDIDLAETALTLGAIFLPGLNTDRYSQHLKKLSEQVEAEFRSRCEKEEDTLALRIQVLRKIIHETNEYTGDEKNYDDTQNANFIRVIERRRGLPISLSIIYISLARKMGWVCEGLNFPGHFLIRMEKDSARIILDPFKGGTEMNAAELRQLLKSIAGKNAELSHNFYDAVSNREILLRLENNLKKRLIDSEDYENAIVVAEAIETFSPQEYRTYLDKGVLYAKLGKKREAIAALETYIGKAPLSKEKQQGRQLLQQIKSEI